MPTLREAISRLVSAFGSAPESKGKAQDHRSRFESLIDCYWERVGSVKQAEAVLSAFDELGILEPRELAEFDPSSLGDMLRQSSLSVSPKLLKPFLRLIRLAAIDRPGLLEGDDDREQLSTETLRDELTAIPGIGRATADAILLKVFSLPVYPLDRATYRVLFRHGWTDTTADYDEVSDLLIRNSDEDPNLLANLTLWFEHLGRSHCRAGGPRCERCPLQPLLPEQGPLEDDS